MRLLLSPTDRKTQLLQDFLLRQQNQGFQLPQGFQLLQDSQLLQETLLSLRYQSLLQFQLLQDQSPPKDLVNRMLPWSHHQ